MQDDERKRLRSELIRLGTIGFEDFVIITLLSGENLFIQSPLQLVVGRLLIHVYPRDRGEIFFPVTNVSSIEVH